MAASRQPAASVPPDFLALGTHLSELGRAQARAACEPILGRLGTAVPEGERQALFDAVLGVLRRFYAESRSGEALPVARALQDFAERAQCETLRRRAYGACGLLFADSGEVVGGLEWHVKSLRLAAQMGSALEVARCWNNIGLAFAVAGAHGIAVRCYLRVLAYTEGQAGPCHPRFTAYLNLSSSCYHLGRVDEGLRHGAGAVDLLLPQYSEQDPHTTILMHRNLIRLLVRAGRAKEAQSHLQAMCALYERSPSLRSLVAVDTSRAACDLAAGRPDIAATRIDGALGRARMVPAALPDALQFAIHAEEVAGHPERALERARELAALIYRTAVTRARDHIELAELVDASRDGLAAREEGLRARLLAEAAPRSAPETWDVLQRLAMAAVLPMDRTGAHGARVGALARLLALASECSPLEAMDIGAASELHDIGLSAVPANIVAKRARLTDDERLALQAHAAAGAEMLCHGSGARALLAREIARYHHARWDGQGYPPRVGGPFIPLPARMCAIADAFDAMVCGLGTRTRKSIPEAIAALRAEAGGQFDPGLVERFVAIILDHASEYGIEVSSEHAGRRTFHELIDSLVNDRGFI